MVSLSRALTVLYLQEYAPRVFTPV